MQRATMMALMLASMAGGGAAAQLPRGMVRIEGGSFRPLDANTAGPVQVASFAMDTVPVSLASFLQFVREQPDWARGRVPAQRADENYLKDQHATALSSVRPATQVSWFAAAAYCAARGARLPTTLEWEYSAQASERDRNAGASPAFRQRTLELALAADARTFRIGSGFRNVWGVRDLHGGVMEWTADFQGGSNHTHHDEGATCGAGTTQTGDGGDYAAFLRASYRQALTPNTTAANLGFRCAADLDPTRAPARKRQ